MIGYLAVALTLVLAMLGIFFSKSGEANKISRVGRLILWLTIISGIVALLDAHGKRISSDEQKRTIDKLRSDATRLNNLNIASVVGIDKKFRQTILWISVESMEDGEDHPERVPSSHLENFVDVLVSKSDAAQKVSIELSHLNNEIKVELSPKTPDTYHVKQSVNGLERTYSCTAMCGSNIPPPSRRGETPLAHRNIVIGEAIDRSINFGIDLSDEASVGRVISELQRITAPYGTLKVVFSSWDEYVRFLKFSSAFRFVLKFHGSTSPTREPGCSLAVFAPFSVKAKNSLLKMTAEFELGQIGSLDIDLCETSP